MRLFPRRRSVPDAVRAVDLPPGERRVAWALTVQGDPVVATAAGLRLPGRALLPWHLVERATWQRPVLTVREVAEVADTGTAHVLELDDAGDLPEVVRDRVTGSVAWTTTARLDPQGGVRIVGRRVPGQEAFAWQLVYDAGTDPADPLVRAQAEQALRAARTTIG